MKYYAVVDTNVLVSALISNKDDASTVQVFQRILLRDVMERIILTWLQAISSTLLRRGL